MATPEQREEYLRQLLQMARDEGAVTDIIDVAFDYGRSVTPKVTKEELRAALLREISARAPSGSSGAEQARPAAGALTSVPGATDAHPEPGR